MEKRENTGIEQSGSKENHASSSSNNAPHPKSVSNIEELRKASEALKRLNNVISSSSTSTSQNKYDSNLNVQTTELTSSSLLTTSQLNTDNSNYIRSLTIPNIDIHNDSNQNLTSSTITTLSTSSCLNTNSLSNDSANGSLSNKNSSILQIDTRTSLNTTTTELSSPLSTKFKETAKRDALSEIQTNELHPNPNFNFNLNQFDFDLDENYKFRRTSQSIEDVLNSEMFLKLFEIQKNLINSSSSINDNNNMDEEYENDKTNLNENGNQFDISELESDDSYAAEFKKCLERVIVYSSGAQPISTINKSNLNINCGALFRIVLLRNKINSNTNNSNKSDLFVFLIKINDNYENGKYGLSVSNDTQQFESNRNDELWLWWCKDEENNLETINQLLCVNGVYFDKLNFELAYNLLLRTRGEVISNKSNNNNHLVKLDLLISRNLNKSLIKKNLKKPNLISYNLIKSVSSSSSSASVSALNTPVSVDFSINTISLQSDQKSEKDNSSKSDANKGNVRVLSSRTENSKPILIYDLNNDCLRKSIEEYNENLYDIDPTCSTSSTSSSVINKKSKEKFRFNKNIKNQMTLSDMMVLNTEWTQLETIELLNESSSSGSNSNLNKTAQTVINATQIGTSPSSSSSGGFGFGITGNKSTGVVVKAITPGGSAHKDGRLRINDQIFQIGEINVRSMSSEQVAAVLRQSSMQGQCVKFIVARPVHNKVNDVELVDQEGDASKSTPKSTAKPKMENLNANSQAFLIRTSEILDKNINLQQRVLLEMEQQKAELANLEQEKEPDTKIVDVDYLDKKEPSIKEDLINLEKKLDNIINKRSSIIEESNKKFEEQTLPKEPEPKPPAQLQLDVIESYNIVYKIEINRCNNKDISSSPTSKTTPTPKTEYEEIINLDFINAELKSFFLLIDSKQIDDFSLVTNDSVDNNNNNNNNETTPLPKFSLYIKEKLFKDLENSNLDLAQIDLYDQLLEINSLPVHKLFNDYKAQINLIESLKSVDKLCLKLSKNFKFKSNILKTKWYDILKKDDYDVDDNLDIGFDIHILVGLIDKRKSKNLGISLEGTVDVDDNGLETYPHHYIRSVMTDGPVDRAKEAEFKAGDELLEVEFVKLYAINYLELLDILKQLANKLVVMVCARKVKKLKPERPILISDSLNQEEAANSKNAQNKMTKRAKSECFLSSSSHSNSTPETPHEDKNFIEKTNSTTSKLAPQIGGGAQLNEESIVQQTNKLSTAAKSSPIITESINDPANETKVDKLLGLNKLQKTASAKIIRTPQLCIRSRSLELNGLALWNKPINYINLIKSEKGLGFSLIDYQQDPFNPLAKTMIVIRALVPNGVAQLDGRLIPGQRLVSINDVILDEDLIRSQNEEIKSISTPSLHKSTNSISKLTTPPTVPKFDLLKYTVNCLKSLPVGQIVRLGVQKPLPYPDAEPIVVGSTKIEPSKAQSLKSRAKSSQSSYSLGVKTPNAMRKKKRKATKKKIITTSHYNLENDKGEESAEISKSESGDGDEEELEDELENNKHYNEDLIDASIEVERKHVNQDKSRLDRSKSAVLNSKEKAKHVEYEFDEEKNHYGLVATSAPAILNEIADGKARVKINGDGLNAKNGTHSFYSSSSLLKLNTIGLYNQICAKSETNSKTGSAIELKSEFVETIQTLKSTQLSKSKSVGQHMASNLVQEQAEKPKKTPKIEKPTELNLNVEFQTSTPKIQPAHSSIKSCIRQTNLILDSTLNPDEKIDEIAEISHIEAKKESTLNDLETSNSQLMAERVANSAMYLNYLLNVNDERLYQEPDLALLEQTRFDNYDFEFFEDDIIDGKEGELDKARSNKLNKYFLNDKQLVTEEQFNQAFILNTNKKLINLIETNRIVQFDEIDNLDIEDATLDDGKNLLLDKSEQNAKIEEDLSVLSNHIRLLQKEKLKNEQSEIDKQEKAKRKQKRTKTKQEPTKQQQQDYSSSLIASNIDEQVVDIQKQIPLPISNETNKLNIDSNKAKHKSNKSDKSNTILIKSELNLDEMVKDMATFKWPQLDSNDLSDKNQQKIDKNDYIKLTDDKSESPKQNSGIMSGSANKCNLNRIKQIKFDEGNLNGIKKLEHSSESNLIRPIKHGELITDDNNNNLKCSETAKSVSKLNNDIEQINKTRSLSSARSYSGTGSRTGVSTLCGDGTRFRSISQGKTSASVGYLSKSARSLTHAASTSTAASKNSSRSGSVKIINILGKEIIKLPSQLEREIKIKKKFDPLGISSVDCHTDEGINGCVVLKIEPNTACAKDNRLKEGDYLLSVNNEQMRNLTNSSAKAVLNRASLTSSDVVIIYIPLSEARKYKRSLYKSTSYSDDFLRTSDKKRKDKIIHSLSALSITSSSSSCSSDSTSSSSSRSTSTSSNTSLSYSTSSSSSTSSSTSSLSRSGSSRSASSSLTSSTSSSRTRSLSSSSMSSIEDKYKDEYNPRVSNYSIDIPVSSQTNKVNKSSIKAANVHISKMPLSNTQSCNVSIKQINESTRANQFNACSSDMIENKVKDINSSKSLSSYSILKSQAEKSPKNRDSSKDNETKKIQTKSPSLSSYPKEKEFAEDIKKLKDHHSRSTHHHCHCHHKHHKQHKHHKHHKHRHHHSQEHSRSENQLEKESNSSFSRQHHSHSQTRSQQADSNQQALKKRNKSLDSHTFASVAAEKSLAPASLTTSVTSDRLKSPSKQQISHKHHSHHHKHKHRRHHKHKHHRHHKKHSKEKRKHHRSHYKHHKKHRKHHKHHHKRHHRHHSQEKTRSIEIEDQIEEKDKRITFANEPLDKATRNEDEIKTQLISSIISSQNQDTDILMESSSGTIMSTDITASLWGPTRLVVLSRQPNKSLGISIVGGKLDVCSSSNSSTTGNLADIGKSGKDQVSSFISGIFIKHVLENSPAGVNGTLKTGDRILAVNDVDLTQATHDRAVEVIRNAKSPVRFLIQSLICASNATLTTPAAASLSSAPSNLINTNASNSSNASDLESSPMNYQGRLLEAQICKDEADIIDPDKQIIDESNKYNYTLENMKEKYNYLIELNASTSQIGSGSPNDDLNKENSTNMATPKAPNTQLYIFKLVRTNPSESLGLSLSGNVNLNKTSVFVCGIYANSIAHRHGLIRVGDQILEINGHSLYGRAHSNVTPLIRNIKDLDVYIVVLRNSDNLNQMYKPIQPLPASRSTSGSQSPCSINNDAGTPTLSGQPVLGNSTNNSNSLSPALMQKVEEQFFKKPLKKSTRSDSTITEKTEAALKPSKKILLKKGSTGFGIAISEDRHNRLIVRGLNPNGIAFNDGRMQIGDEIIAVNDTKVSTMKYDDVMNLLHETQEGSCVEFQITKPEAITAVSSTVHSNTSPIVSGATTPLPNKQPPQIPNQPVQNQSSITTTTSPPKTPTAPSLPSNHSISPTAQTKKSIDKHESGEESFSVSQSKPKTSTPTSPKEQSIETSDSSDKDLYKSKVLNNEPKTAQIRIGEETLIEIERGKMGLGLSIVGGSDTQLPGIIIHDIYQNGAAFRDKRLAIGDQILRVNNVDLSNATHEQALTALRQTSEFVRLLIHRGFLPHEANLISQSGFGINPKVLSSPSSEGQSGNNSSYGFGYSNDEKFLNVINIELNKKFAKGLGFSIIGRRDGSGVFISHIIEGGCAHKDGRLMIGDLILEVNGQDIRKSPYNDVAFLLKTLPQGKVNLKIGRFKTSANVSASNSANVSTNTSANDSKQTSRRNSITLLNNNNNTQLTETTTQQDSQQQSSSNLSSFKSKK